MTTDLEARSRFALGIGYLAAAAMVGCVHRARHPGPPPNMISIHITAEPTKLDASLVHVIITNLGSEAAHDVRPALEFLGKKMQSEPVPLLAPGAATALDLRTPAVPLEPGSWPFGVRVSYTDANSYPFQALHVRTLTVGAAPSQRTAAVTSMIVSPVVHVGMLRVTLKNLTDTPRKVQWTTWVPDGFAAETPASRTVDLGPWSDVEVRIALANRPFLPSSKLPVFVVLDQETGAAHESAVYRRIVSIVAPKLSREQMPAVITQLRSDTG